MSELASTIHDKNFVSNDELQNDEPQFEHSPNASEKDFAGPASPSSECSKDSEHEGHFFDRLNSIPLVAESLDFVTKYANDDHKAYSKYVKFALNKAEVGFNKVTHIAEAKFPSQITAADHMALSTLSYIEDKFPAVMNTTSSDVYNSSRQAISEIVATPQAALNSTIDSIASNAEVILDRFLPTDQDSEASSKDVGVARLRHVGVDATRRISLVVRSQIDTISSTGSQVPLLNLAESNKILERATKEVATLNEKMVHMLHLTKENAISYKQTGLQYIQESQNTLVSRFSKELEAASAYLKSHSTTLPEAVRTHIEPSLKFLNDRYSKVSAELQNKDHSPVEKARTAMLLATDSVPYLEDICRYLSNYLAPPSS